MTRNICGNQVTTNANLSTTDYNQTTPTHNWCDIYSFFSELGLCDDRKRLMKKKTRRGLKEGDVGYLDKASGTDSAMEDRYTRINLLPSTEF